MDIAIEQGDLLVQDVDLIVNPANSLLAHGGGLARKIADAAGEELVAESERKAPLPVGGAVATTAGRLPFRAVIHAVGPQWGGGTYQEPKLLELAHLSAMDIADHFGCAWNEKMSIAFPAISCGIFRYPVERAAEVAIRTMKQWPGRLSGKVGLVKFVLFEDEHFAAFTNTMRQMRG